MVEARIAVEEQAAKMVPGLVRLEPAGADGESAVANSVVQSGALGVAGSIEDL